MTKHFPGAKCWGVEELSTEDRVAKIIDAGCDQLGGERLPEVIVSLVRSGRIPEERIDESARRILRDKFRLGLFDDPFVHPDVAGRVCGQPKFVAAGERAQRRSAALIKNDGTLPLSGGEDVAIVRKTAPFEPRTRSSRASSTPATSTSRSRSSASCSSSRARSRRCSCSTSSVPRSSPSWSLSTRRCWPCSARPTTRSRSCSTDARSPSEGTLPFELPSSMESVRAQKPDVPGDSEEPLFRFGHGLFY